MTINKKHLQTNAMRDNIKVLNLIVQIHQEAIA